MRKALGISVALVAALLIASTSLAEKRPHEGTVVRVETVERSADVGGQSISNLERSMIVRGEKGDEWTLYWDDTTKFKHDLSPTRLRQGDHVHFEFVEKDGKMWLTELRRTKKADRD